jgi:ABC-2 type transport system ATP-binding protein
MFRGEVLRDDDALALQVSSDGSVKSLKAVLDRLAEGSIEVDGLAVHTPDLDDVFLALTGAPKNEPKPEKVAVR